MDYPQKTWRTKRFFFYKKERKIYAWEWNWDPCSKYLRSFSTDVLHHGYPVGQCLRYARTSLEIIGIYLIIQYCLPPVELDTQYLAQTNYIKGSCELNPTSYRMCFSKLLPIVYKLFQIKERQIFLVLAHILLPICQTY